MNACVIVWNTAQLRNISLSHPRFPLGWEILNIHGSFIWHDAARSTCAHMFTSLTNLVKSHNRWLIKTRSQNKAFIFNGVLLPLILRLVLYLIHCNHTGHRAIRENIIVSIAGTATGTIYSNCTNQKSTKLHNKFYKIIYCTIRDEQYFTNGCLITDIKITGKDSY